MLVAITGARGAVGSRLVTRHIEVGDTVRVLSRRRCVGWPATAQVFRGDLTSDRDVLATFADGADVLYHCAAEIHDRAKMRAVNVDGTCNLIEAARDRIGHWVQLGSVAVYGTPAHGIIDEETPLRPVDVYGDTKARADMLVQDAARAGCFTFSVLRPAKIFGAGIASDNNEILYRLFAVIDKGYFFFIGKPGAFAHYVHVDNIIEALVCCGRADGARNAVFNLSDDCALEEFVAAASSTLGKPTPTLRLPETLARALVRALGWLPGFPLDERRVSALVNRAQFPSDRLERDTGYSHRVPVTQGLRELVAVWKHRR